MLGTVRHCKRSNHLRSVTLLAASSSSSPLSSSGADCDVQLLAEQHRCTSLRLQTSSVFHSPPDGSGVFMSTITATHTLLEQAQPTHRAAIMSCIRSVCCSRNRSAFQAVPSYSQFIDQIRSVYTISIDFIQLLPSERARSRAARAVIACAGNASSNTQNCS